MADSDVGIKLVAEDASFKTAMTNANQLIKQMAQECKEAASGVGDLGSKQESYSNLLEAQKQKLELLNQAHTTAAEKLRALAEAYEKAKESGDPESIGKAADAYTRQSTEVSKLETEMSKCREAINGTTQELDKIGQEMTEADNATEDFDQSLDDLSQSAEQSGNGFNAMTAALGNLIAEGIKRAADAIKDFVSETINVGKEFDASMSQVSATSGAAGDDLQALRDKAKEMGEGTKFSATEAAEAFNYMAMAGWDTQQMLGGIEGVLHLAAAGNTDLATTSDIVTDALTAFGESADQAGRLADIMAAAASSANTNVAMMGETFKYAAPVAGTLGYSMEDIAVAIGLMANAGIKGSQAGTSLRSALTNLANPTTDMQNKMKELGLAVDEVATAIDSEKLKAAQANYEKKVLSLEQAQLKYNEAVKKYGENSTQAQTALINVQKATVDLEQAQAKLNKEQEGSIETHNTTNQLLKDEEGNMRSFGDIIAILRDKFKNLTEEEQAQAAATLFGKEAMSGMLGIINASDEDFKKLQEAIDGSAGSAEKMAEIMEDNLEGDLTKLHSKIESVQINLYEKFEPALRDGVAALSDLVDGIAGFIEKAADFVKWLNSGSTEAEALKTVLIAVGTAIAAFATITGVIAIIEKLQIAFAALNATLLANPIALVVAAIAGLVAAFVTLWNKSEEFRNFWIGLWEAIKGAAQAVWDAITKLFTEAWEGIKELWNTAGEFFGTVWEGIKGAFKDVGNWFSERFKEARSWTEQAFQDVGTWFGDRYKDIQTAMEPVGQWFQDRFKEARDWTEQAWKDIGSWMGDRKKDVETAWTGIDKWMGNTFGDAWTEVKNAFSKFVDFFTEIWEKVKQVFSVVESVLKGDFEGAWNGIKGIWDQAVGFFSDIWEKIKGVFSPAFDAFSDIGSKIIEGIKSGVGKLWDGFKNWFSGLFDGLLNGVKGIFGIHSPSKEFERIGGYIIKGFVYGVDKNAWMVESAMDRAFGDLSNVRYVPFQIRRTGTGSAAGDGEEAAQVQQQPINLQIDGKTFARLTAPYIDMQQGRAWSRQVALGVAG